MVKTSPVEKIFVIQEGRDCYKKLAPIGESITEAEFEITGREGYIRVEIRDGKGLYAGTNAFWMDKVMSALAESGWFKRKSCAGAPGTEKVSI